MPRKPRIVIPDVPYHVTQRGNNGQDVFFSSYDRKRYLEWLALYSSCFEFDIIAYCLMTNHVHLVGIPHNHDSMAKTIQTVHMRYTQTINRHRNRIGHLWHNRYYSTALDESHLWQAARYVEQNPVRAGIARNAEEYLWSSAAYHCGIRDDMIVTRKIHMPGLFDGWKDILHELPDKEVDESIRGCTYRGVPYGDARFMRVISDKVGYGVIDRGVGRPRKSHK